MSLIPRYCTHGCGGYIDEKGTLWNYNDNKCINNENGSGTHNYQFLPQGKSLFVNIGLLLYFSTDHFSFGCKVNCN